MNIVEDVIKKSKDENPEIDPVLDALKNVSDAQ